MHVHHIPTGSFSSNVYVVNESLLVDAGMDANAVLSSPYTTNIESIVLTHCHIDHTKAAPSIIAQTDATLLCGGVTAKNLSDAVTSVATMFGYEPPKLIPDVLLKDGDNILVGEVELKVLLTPGHTEGSICLFEEENGVLFSGDVVFADGGFGRYDLPGGSLSSLLNSLERLMELDIHSLYPGHGPYVEDEAYKHVEISFERVSSLASINE
ncbi:MAG: MBL fold metallo-hydrolase [Methermicoccaceae archaeon]